MICKKCNSEWNTSGVFQQSNRCPFCGATLDGVEFGKSNNSLDNIVKNIIAEFGPNILLNASRFQSILLDYAPKLKKERKILSLALDEGVADYFVNCAESDREANVNRAKNKMSLLMSDEAINMVIRCFSYALDWKIEEIKSLNPLTVNYDMKISDVSSNNVAIGIEIRQLITVGYCAVISAYINGSPIIIGKEELFCSNGGVTIDNQGILELLIKSKLVVKNYLAEELRFVSISIPSIFTGKHRRFIASACESMGIKVQFVRTCNAIAFSQFNENEEINAVIVSICGHSYDIGTFEVSCGVCTNLSNNISSNFNGISFMAESEWNNIKQIISDSIKQSGWNNTDVDTMLLCGDIVGESVLIKDLEKKFGDKVKTISENSVAWGTSIHSAINQNITLNDTLLLLNAIPYSIGLETVGGIFTAIIEKNTSIPVKKSVVFSTSVDNQPAIDFTILYGENHYAKDNEKLGEIRFSGILPAKAGIPKIEITFEVDKCENITVLARDITFPDSIRNLGKYHI